MHTVEIFSILNSNPVFYLATCDGNQPRVRGMLLFKADEDGITFHTSSIKDVYFQIEANPNVEMCFYDMQNNLQIRISGKVEEITDKNLKDEISNHSSRQFIKAWQESGVFKDFYNEFKVFSLKNGKAVVWTYATNFSQKNEILL